MSAMVQIFHEVKDEMFFEAKPMYIPYFITYKAYF